MITSSEEMFQMKAARIRNKTELCKFGCGNRARYKLGNGGLICQDNSAKCPVNRKKISNGTKQAHKDGRIPVFGDKRFDFKTQMTPEIRKKAGKTLSENIRSGKTKASWAGRHHSIDTRRQISRKMSAFNNGFVKTKYFEIFCPYQQKNVKVQGTWEFAYATYLNENKINWVRSRKIQLKFKWNEDDYEHLYYPDFYLPDTNEYIEIKGFYFKSKDGKIDDRTKMQKVFEQNPDKKITVLMKQELLELGLDIH